MATSVMESKKEPKVFNDPIHGHMEFHPLLVKIIDTPEFQRLRNIKQLGGGYYVYPAASHNRFEHSLGVAHLAGEFVRSLQKNQPELDITERDILCVEIAGLCHDLGHGPFSHMFDRKFIPKARRDLRGWEHENASIQIFEHIVENLDNTENDQMVKDLKDLLDKKEEEEEKKKKKEEEEKKKKKKKKKKEEEEEEKEEGQELLTDNNEDNDLYFIEEMIIGPTDGQYKGRKPDKHFLYEIVANKNNGIDVDKFDYFARDCYHLGMKNSFDHLRYFKFARVCDVNGKRRICARDKELSNIYDMFHTRSRLHQKAYQHKTTLVIEMMITEAFFKADPILKISDALDGNGVVIEKYIKLTDDIFGEILHYPDSGLDEAKEILNKIVSRKIYKHLGKTKRRTEEQAPTKAWKAELAGLSQLAENDFEIIISPINYGKKKDNPLDDMYFYRKSDIDNPFLIPTEQVSDFLLPRNFSEEWIHVYCKDPEKEDVAYKSFLEWCRKKNFLVPPVNNMT